MAKKYQVVSVYDVTHQQAELTAWLNQNSRNGWDLVTFIGERLAVLAKEDDSPELPVNQPSVTQIIPRVN